jgi:hypothetical protein
MSPCPGLSGSRVSESPPRMRFWLTAQASIQPIRLASAHKRIGNDTDVIGTGDAHYAHFA